MSTFPGSPRLIKGGIVLVNPETSVVIKVISLQYNPESISRTLQVQSIGESGEKSEAMRLTGPPVETIKLDAEIDATDLLETADSTAVQTGIQTQLAVLETILYPTCNQLTSNNRLAKSGTLEIIPMETPLTLFVWNKNRIMPIRLTDFSVTEEAFDQNLNPIRAKVSIGMRVLTIDDLGFDHIGGSLYMNYHKNKEKLAQKMRSGILSELGIKGIS